FEVSAEALEQMQNHVSPIVLLPKVNGGTSWLNKYSSVSASVAPGLNEIGVMLPYTPLYELLLQHFGKPIIATSGNVSSSPIIYEDEKALLQFSGLADFVLTNNRKIVVPQDDSVIRYSAFAKQKIILRRSRGLAPGYFDARLKCAARNIVGMGAMLKSTFSLLHQGNVYISQYLGDLQHFDTLQNYKHTLQHFLRLFKAVPELILTDLHPEYPSTWHGQSLARVSKLPVKTIQHHIAHFGAIIGEHDLIRSEQPLLGVIWDGTGLGTDKQIWGGEFFKYENYEFQRCCHFDYFDFVLGDKMPREPRISALSACWEVAGAEQVLRPKFSGTEWQVYQKILSKKQPLQTSSVGRIFDAVASLLGIMDKQSYEGEAAIRLETLATQYVKSNGFAFDESYFGKNDHHLRISTHSLMTNILSDLRSGKATDYIAARFHYSLAMLVKIVANNLKIKQIAFSGGVFQNGLLVDLLLYHLKADFTLYFHQQLSPNDENISFGQLMIHQILFDE
ncbi:MAG: Sua5/YciO/YrdC/YwlC family protein, partial [Bacteroidota bacterium]